MGHYVDQGCQTEIQGLCKDPASRPQALMSPQPPADTPTPPDDMALDKLKLAVQDAPPNTAGPKKHQDDNNMQPSMMLKRKTRPAMVARISLPAADLGEDNPRSPPPTEAVMSPLPAANRLHAGHTPIIPRSFSPLPASEGPATPDGDDGLSGPLTLPPQPGDGAEDTIPLHVLDQELEKLRIEQERERALDEPRNRSDSTAASEPDHEDDAAPLSRKTSKEARKTPPEEFDGVILKKPKMNMGAPLGQA